MIEHCRRSPRPRGFTAIELIVIIVVTGILAAVVMPKFADRAVFAARGFHDETKSLLRYAQKAAIAQHRFVCVTFTTTGASLSIGATNACGTPLTGPRGDTPFAIHAGTDTGYGAQPSDFNFDASGRPSAGQVISVTGGDSVTVEAETGYVH